MEIASTVLITTHVAVKKDGKETSKGHWERCTIRCLGGGRISQKYIFIPLTSKKKIYSSRNKILIAQIAFSSINLYTPFHNDKNISAYLPISYILSSTKL